MLAFFSQDALVRILSSHYASYASDTGICEVSHLYGTLPTPLLVQPSDTTGSITALPSSPTWLSSRCLHATGPVVTAVDGTLYSGLIGEKVEGSRDGT